jgi:hypothetical protein
LVDVEGLLDVVVGTGFETALDVKLAGFAADENQRNVLEVFVLLSKTVDYKSTVFATL